MKIASLLVLCASLTLTACGETTPTVDKTIPSPTVGDPDAGVSMTIYSDHQCSACAVFHEYAEKRIIDEYANTGRLHITYKHFPLDIHPNAERDALAALCAEAQDRYLDYADAIYALESERGGRRVSDGDRIDLAQDLELDVPTFTTCMQESHYLTQVRDEYREAMEKDLPGTPSVLIDGSLVRYSTLDELLRLIDAAVENAETESES